MREPRTSLRLILFLARRNLLESRLSLALLVGAVAAGVGFQVPNAANQAGYEAELLREAVSAGNGDVRVRPRQGSSFDDAEPLLARLAAYPGVRAAVPVLALPGAIKGRGPLLGALVVGAHTEAPLRPFRMVSGRPLARGDATGALVGVSLAERLGVHVGDTVELRVFLTPGPALVDEDNLGRYTMTVRGLTGGTFGAQEAVFLDRAFLAQEAGTPRAASMILVHLHNHSAAQRLAQRIAADVPSVQARAWIDDSAYLASSFRASAAVGAVSQAMVIAAVAIPVLALLYVNVLGRRRDIGLLAAIGFGPRDIFAVFLTQALVVGLFGAAAGCGIGCVLIRYFQLHPIFEWEGFVIRPLVGWACFWKPVAVVVGATLAAGVYPAVRAARMDPAPVFRGVV